jgi:hypothetical protein
MLRFCVARGKNEEEGVNCAPKAPRLARNKIVLLVLAYQLCLRAEGLRRFQKKNCHKKTTNLRKLLKRNILLSRF